MMHALTNLIGHALSQNLALMSFFMVFALLGTVPARASSGSRNTHPFTFSISFFLITVTTSTNTISRQEKILARRVKLFSGTKPNQNPTSHKGVGGLNTTKNERGWFVARLYDKKDYQLHPCAGSLARERKRRKFFREPPRSEPGL